MSISAAARTSLRKYLDSIPKRFQAQGERMSRSVAFGEKVGETTEAVVYGPSGGSYRVTLYVVQNVWVGSCSCVDAVDCHHCYAVTKALLQKLPTMIEQPADVQQPGRTERPGMQTSRTEQPSHAPQPAGRVRQPEKSQQTPAGAFAAELAGKLGRKLKPAELDYATSFYEFWKQNRGSQQVTGRTLSRLVEGGVGWDSSNHQLWDKAPETPWDGWLYFAAFLAKNKKALPTFLGEITKPEEVDAITADWKRRVASAQWTQSIKRYVRDSTAVGRRVELRAVFGKEALLLECREADLAKPFTVLKEKAGKDLEKEWYVGKVTLDPVSREIWNAFRPQDSLTVRWSYGFANDAIWSLLSNPALSKNVVTEERKSFAKSPAPLVWLVTEPKDASGDYEFRLTTTDGSELPSAVVVVDGRPGYYVTQDTIYETPPLGALKSTEPVQVPAEVIETSDGAMLLSLVHAPVPARVAERVEHIKARVCLHCEICELPDGREIFGVKVTADFGPDRFPEVFTNGGWAGGGLRPQAKKSDKIVVINRDAMALAWGILDDFGLAWDTVGKVWMCQAGKKFAAEFAEWIGRMPPTFDLRLDPLLATLREEPVSANVRLDVTESGVDWFDVKVSLDVSDTHLSKQEIELLLAAKGGFVRLGAKGWKRLVFQISTEDEKALAEAGLDAREFTGEKHRLHSLQLAGKSTERLLPASQAATIRKRAEEIQTRVAPDVPATVRAELRPYQLEGFHFLAYLSTNRFGGILADDMGLGKTLQTLAWMEWLRGQNDSEKHPILVVCPKSVVLNWQSEANRFLPKLRVATLEKGMSGAEALKRARAQADLIIINYAQLRFLETELLSVRWLAAALDEAQFIKNPDSQTTRVAVQLQAQYRLALTGTPIENRLLDLWSIMSFGMPGALGNRVNFQKCFDQKKDPYARLRLASRVRPFVLRRTKSEVAKDLPERSEEDLLCEMEGVQANLYAAELKRARQMLLKVKTAKELDDLRFNFLTSLLRLRQICCHPVLVTEKAAKEESAKLTALLDLLEPLMEEGHKVLVFSQFTGMLDLIQAAIREREWKSFLLTGQTEDRQSLVNSFQSAEGAAVFMISLKAGGFGLNLTAASYVVLFDPWWNPAVENQAIDRTHRIGQTNKVNAYRLVVKGSIEEKIRHLQKQKRALADDVLGEEAFAKTLSLDDFKFLVGEES